MEGQTEAASAAGAPAHNFSKVVFQDIPHSYPPSTSVTCSYTLTASFQPNSRDWVGIFKVGWSTTKDYHTFVWVEQSLDVSDQQSLTRQAVFKDYYLPKDESEFYQFCYVDSTGQVRGASTPFCFKSTGTSLESSPDDELLVITTQEQVDQSVWEKAELQRELDRKMAENETLKSALQQRKKEAATFKEQNEEKETENSQLVKELDEMKELNKTVNSMLQQKQKEMDEFKEEMLTQMTKQKQQQEEREQKILSQSLCEETTRQKEAQAQEKYDRAVAKIKQLKAERDELKGKVEAQSLEISTLNSRIREQEKDLRKMDDRLQLLQVDLQSSEKEKEKLSADLQRLRSVSHNTDDLNRENKELIRRLSELETHESSSDDELRGEYQNVCSRLQETQVKLLAEKEESKTAKWRADTLNKELQDTKEQLNKVMRLYEEAQQTSSKQELLLREAREQIDEKETIIGDTEVKLMLERHEKEELARENQMLMRSNEGLRSLNAELQATPPTEPPHVHHDPSPPSHPAPTTYERQQSEIREQEEHAYETIGSIEPESQQEEEQSLVCRHCQESFPGITPEELEQHERSHRVCPFCAMICDDMEQSVYEDHVYGHEL